MTHDQQIHLAKIPNWHEIIASTEAKFSDSSLGFAREQIFATQLLMNNSRLLDVAKSNLTSLKLALHNVAAVGLTLNPNQGLAYLVSRRFNRHEQRKIVLDISYRGLISIAVETGSIRWAKAELVYSRDQFQYNGPAVHPEHQCDPFSRDRGEVIGGYCIAELPSHGVLVDLMSRVDMDKIRDASEAFRQGFGPWVDWEDQMQLKSIIKRARKWWPMSNARMATALHVLNVENGEGLAAGSIEKSILPLDVCTDRHAPLKAQDKHAVDQLIERAVAHNALNACREVIDSRFHDANVLAYAYEQLEALASGCIQMQAGNEFR